MFRRIVVYFCILSSSIVIYLVISKITSTLKNSLSNILEYMKFTHFNTP